MPENISSQFNRVFAFPIETFRSVNSILDRDNIPGGVRWEGMHVYVAQAGEKKTYELRGGLTNDFWEPISDVDIDVAVDAAFSATSTNPVQNQVITNGMYQRTQLQTSGQAQVHWGNITNTPTTLSGYGVTDAYTQTQINNLLGDKADDLSVVKIGDTGNNLSNTDDPDAITGSTLTYSAMSEVGAPTWASTDGMVLTGRRSGSPVDRQLWVGRLGEIGLRGGSGGGGYSEPWIQIATRDWVNGQSFLTEETDPTVPSYVKAITQTDITNWDTAFGWGNHATAGYVPETRTLTTGEGLNSIGDLSQDRNITLDFDYLDNRYTEGFKQHPAVRVATTGNITLSGLQTIDGVTLVSGDRVLVKNQTAAEDNGIYIAASGAWTRASDFDEGIPTEAEQGASVFVEEGTLLSSTGWTLETPDPITVGTTPLSFIQYAGANNYTGGDLITIDGNQINHDPGSWTSKTNLSGASVISNLAVDGFGHLTDWTTRNLTASDIGALTEADLNDRLPFYEFPGTVTDLDILPSSLDYANLSDANTPPFATSDGGVLTLAGGTGRQLWFGRHGEVGVRAVNDPWYQLATQEWVTDQGYLTSFTETDPTVPAHVKAITQTDITNWNTAFSWGDHSVAGYELESNKATNFSTLNNTLYPSTLAVDANFFSQNSVFSENDADTYLNVGGMAAAIRDTATGFPSLSFATLIAGFGVGDNPQLWMPHADSDTNRPQYRVVSSAGTETWNELAYLSDIPSGSIQTLGFTNGDLSISGGNSVNLDSRYYTESEVDNRFIRNDFNSLAITPNTSNDANALYTSFHFFNADSPNTPNEVNGGYILSGRISNTNLASQLYLGTNDRALYYRSTTNGTLPSWYQIGMEGSPVSMFNNDAGYITSADIPATPTLQEVTTAGNATSNVIQVTGLNNEDFNIAGTSIYNNGFLVRTTGGTLAGQFIVNDIESQLVHTPSGSSITLQNEDGTEAGSQFSTRVSGLPAVNANDFATLSQLESSAGLPFSVNPGTITDLDAVPTSFDYANASDINSPSFATTDGAVLTLGGGVKRQLWWGRHGEFGVRGGTGSVPYDQWYQIATQEWVTTQIPETPTLQQVTAEGNTADNNVIVPGILQAGTAEIASDLTVAAGTVDLTSPIVQLGANSFADPATSINQPITGENAGFGLSWNDTANALDWTGTLQETTENGNITNNAIIVNGGTSGLNIPAYGSVLTHDDSPTGPTRLIHVENGSINSQFVLSNDTSGFGNGNGDGITFSSTTFNISSSQTTETNISEYDLVHNDNSFLETIQLTLDGSGGHQVYQERVLNYTNETSAYHTEFVEETTNLHNTAQLLTDRDRSVVFLRSKHNGSQGGQFELTKRVDEPISIVYPDGDFSSSDAVFTITNRVGGTTYTDDFKLYKNGDIELTAVGAGIILPSPNGTRYLITVDDDGALASNPL